MISYKDDLSRQSWLGEVVDVDDPERSGRARVRVFGKFDDLDVSDVPWASPANNHTAGSSSGGGFLSVPKVGSVVAVAFPDGDLYHPEYRFGQELSKEARDEVRDSYENAHVLLYDTVTDGGLKVFFTENKGLVLKYKGTSMTLKPDESFLLENSNGDKVEVKKNGDVNVKAEKKVTVECRDAKIKASKSIHLDCAKNASVKLGSNVTDAVILGDTFLNMYNSHTHSGNMGYPTGPPNPPAVGAVVLSRTVKTQ